MRDQRATQKKLSNRVFGYEFVISTAVAGILLFAAISSAHANTAPGGSGQPADVYCNDLKEGVNEAFQKAVQSRMPSMTPGEHMDKNYDVQKAVEKEINYGLGSVNDVLNALFSYISSKAQGFKEKLIVDTVSQTMKNAMDGAMSKVSMPSGNTGAGTPPRSLPGTTNSTPSPSAPLMGHAASNQESPGIIDRMGDFFSGLFK